MKRTGGSTHPCRSPTPTVFTRGFQVSQSKNTLGCTRSPPQMRSGRNMGLQLWIADGGSVTCFANKQFCLKPERGDCSRAATDARGYLSFSCISCFTSARLLRNYILIRTNIRSVQSFLRENTGLLQTVTPEMLKVSFLETARSLV